MNALAAWSPYDLPPAVGDESRFAVGSLPAGWTPSSVGETVAHVIGSLVEDRAREAASFRVAPVEVKLRAVVRTTGGDYLLADRGSVAGAPRFENRRPGKRWRKLTGPALLDSLALGGEAFEHAPDLEVWEALRETAARYSLTADALRSLNNAVARLVALRAGLDAHPAHLPNVGAVAADDEAEDEE